MNIRTMKKLEKMGFDKDWLFVIKNEFKPKKNGFYEMRITDIEDFGDDPRHGEYIETTTFNDSRDLSVIHNYFEGFAYVVTDKMTMEVFDSGIIDGALFDVMEDRTGYKWKWFSEADLGAENKVNQERKESMIESLTRENQELMVENAKLRLELARYKA